MRDQRASEQSSGAFFFWNARNEGNVVMETMTLELENARPPSLVESFDSVWVLDSELTAEHWRYLWQRFGVVELVDIGRRSGWFVTGNDHEAILALIERSRRVGFDPLADGVPTELPPREL